MNIEGKTALITGGAHRVGRAITLALAGAGANVVVNYNSSADAANETVKAAVAAGVEAMAFEADVSAYGAVLGMVGAAKDRFGSVDILINAASLFKKTPFPLENISDWQRVTRILIDGSFYCANTVAPLMKESGEGAIVNIVDLSAWQPAKDYIAHSTGKAALLALTRQLAVEMAPKVTVNAIAPGPVLPPPDYSRKQRAEVASGTLLKKWGKPEDVAETVLFLVRSGYITGEYITVDGGQRHAGNQFG